MSTDISTDTKHNMNIDSLCDELVDLSLQPTNADTETNTYPVYVGVKLNAEESKKLDDLLKEKLGKDYDIYKKSRCSEKSPGHVTLGYHNSFPTLEDYHKFVDDNYRSRDGQEVILSFTGYARDSRCVCFTIALPDTIPFYPLDKNLHVTALLKKKPPVYSNFLLERIKKAKDEGTDQPGNDVGEMVVFDEPINVPSTIYLHGELNKGLTQKPKVQ